MSSNSNPKPKIITRTKSKSTRKLAKKTKSSKISKKIPVMHIIQNKIPSADRLLEDKISSRRKHLDSSFIFIKPRHQAIHDDYNNIKENINPNEIPLKNELSKLNGISSRPSLISPERMDYSAVNSFKENCINHPHKKGKYYKIINSSEERVPQENKYCSKCAISLTEKGLKMKEIIISDPALRKTEMENLQFFLNIIKINICTMKKSFSRKRNDIIAFYLKQLERVESIYNMINNILVEERIKASDILNKTRDNILEEMRRHYDEIIEIYGEVSDIQCDIEKNSENIIQNKEHFDDIINGYIQKIQAYDSRVKEIKNHSMILNELSPLKKSTIENAQTIITSLYNTIKMTTSLMAKNTNPSSSEYHSANQSRKSSIDGISNLNKSNLCISFDNKKIFENGLNNSKEEHTKYSSGNNSNKSSSENLGFTMNRDKDKDREKDSSKFKDGNYMGHITNLENKNNQISELKKLEDKASWVENKESQNIPNKLEINPVKFKDLSGPKNGSYLINNNTKIKKKEDLKATLQIKNPKFDQITGLKSNKTQLSERAKSFVLAQNHESNLNHSSNHVHHLSMTHQHDMFPDPSTNRYNYFSVVDLDSIEKEKIDDNIDGHSINSVFEDYEMINDVNDAKPKIKRKNCISEQNHNKYLTLLDRVKTNQSKKCAYYMWLVQNNPMLSHSMTKRFMEIENIIDTKSKASKTICQNGLKAGVNNGFEEIKGEAENILDKDNALNQNELNQTFHQKCKQSRLSSSADEYTFNEAKIKLNMSLDTKGNHLTNAIIKVQ